MFPQFNDDFFASLLKQQSWRSFGVLYRWKYGERCNIAIINESRRRQCCLHTVIVFFLGDRKEARNLPTTTIKASKKRFGKSNPLQESTYIVLGNVRFQRIS